jgi:hypothetical protein
MLTGGFTLITAGCWNIFGTVMLVSSPEEPSSPCVLNSGCSTATRREGGGRVGRTLIGSLAHASAPSANRTPIAFAPPAGRAGSSGSCAPPGKRRRCGPWAAWAPCTRSSTASPPRTPKSTGTSTAAPPRAGRGPRRGHLARGARPVERSPNAFMTGPMFREAAQQHEELTGEQWWVIARDESFSSSRWSCGRSARTAWTPIPDRERLPRPGTCTRRRPGAGPPRARRRHHPAPAEPLDPYRGWGRCRRSSPTSTPPARPRVEPNFFRNSAQPGGIVEVDRRLTTTSSTSSATGGRSSTAACPTRTGSRPGERLKWVDRSYSMRTCSSRSCASVNREIIREAFGSRSRCSARSTTSTGPTPRPPRRARPLADPPRLERTRQALNTRCCPCTGRPARPGVRLRRPRHRRTEAESKI